MDCFDDLGDKFGRKSRSSSQVKVKTKSKVNKKKKKKTRMGKIIPFSTCLRLNRKKKRKGSDEPGTTGQPTTSLTIHEKSMIQKEEIPGTSQQEPQLSLPCTDQFESALSGREQEIVPGRNFKSFLITVNNIPTHLLCMESAGSQISKETFVSNSFTR